MSISIGAIPMKSNKPQVEKQTSLRSIAQMKASVPTPEARI